MRLCHNLAINQIVSEVRLRRDLYLTQIRHFYQTCSKTIFAHHRYIQKAIMLEPIMSSLEEDRIILASSSPRRQEILKSMGLKFEVIPSLYEEDLNPEHYETPGEFVIATAKNKVAELENRLKNKQEKYNIIIGADTMVYYNKKIFGKPKSKVEAKEFLTLLSGQTHEVFTGVCVKSNEKLVSFSEGTKVTFGNLPENVIDAYVESGEPMDKAGAYGIQGKAASLISSIQGDYFNVVGLPLHRLCLALLEIYQPNK